MLNRLAGERAQSGLPPEDLLQEGSVGVLGAIQEFATGAGDDFDRLAEARAAAEMDAAVNGEREARDRDELMVRDANAFAVAEARLRRELGRGPRAGELAEHLEWPVERVEEVAGAVADARERDDEDLLGYLTPDDLIELLDGDGDDA
jgi:DNA-directed RNA polymerase specialized sigma subunit